MFSEEPQLDPTLRGVSGWLLFFIITLLVFAPFGALYMLGLFLVSLETMLYFQPFGLFALCVSLLDVVAAIIGFVIGFLLLRQRRAGIIRAAQTYLLARVGYIVISRLFLLINLTASEAPDSFKRGLYLSLGLGLGLGLAYTILWYLYLERSQRVTATYIMSEMSDERPPAPPVFEGQTSHL